MAIEPCLQQRSEGSSTIELRPHGAVFGSRRALDGGSVRFRAPGRARKDPESRASARLEKNLQATLMMLTVLPLRAFLVGKKRREGRGEKCAWGEERQHHQDVFESLDIFQVIRIGCNVSN